MTIRIKRVYEEPSQGDGYRVLVDRVWPRGMSKERAAVDEWLKDIAPSTELRKWFGHRHDRWDEFRSAYFEELDNHQEALDHLARHARQGTVTLVFGAKNEEHNNAVVIQERLRRMTKKR